MVSHLLSWQEIDSLRLSYAVTDSAGQGTNVRVLPGAQRVFPKHILDPGR